MERRKKTCCFTGHRHILSTDRDWIVENLVETVENLIAHGVVYFGCGGALGFDTLAARTVLALGQKYPHIRLILVLPCMDQTRGWTQADMDEYERIKQAAHKVVYTSDRYTPGCMHKRNRHLVDHSGVCVAYCTRSTGGTAYTVDYARRQGVPVIFIAPSANQ